MCNASDAVLKSTEFTRIRSGPASARDLSVVQWRRPSPWDAPPEAARRASSKHGSQSVAVCVEDARCARTPAVPLHEMVQYPPAPKDPPPSRDPRPPPPPAVVPWLASDDAEDAWAGKLAAAESSTPADATMPAAAAAAPHTQAPAPAQPAPPQPQPTAAGPPGLVPTQQLHAQAAQPLRPPPAQSGAPHAQPPRQPDPSLFMHKYTHAPPDMIPRSGPQHIVNTPRPRPAHTLRGHPAHAVRAAADAARQHALHHPPPRAGAMSLTQHRPPVNTPRPGPAAVMVAPPQRSAPRPAAGAPNTPRTHAFAMAFASSLVQHSEPGPAAARPRGARPLHAPHPLHPLHARMAPPQGTTSAAPSPPPLPLSREDPSVPAAPQHTLCKARDAAAPAEDPPTAAAAADAPMATIIATPGADMHAHLSDASATVPAHAASAPAATAPLAAAAETPALPPGPAPAATQASTAPVSMPRRPALSRGSPSKRTGKLEAVLAGAARRVTRSRADSAACTGTSNPVSTAGWRHDTEADAGSEQPPPRKKRRASAPDAAATRLQADSSVTTGPTGNTPDDAGTAGVAAVYLMFRTVHACITDQRPSSAAMGAVRLVVVHPAECRSCSHAL